MASCAAREAAEHTSLLLCWVMATLLSHSRDLVVPHNLELSGTNLVTDVPQNAGKATDLSEIHPAPSCMLPHPEEGEAPLERGQAGTLCRGGGVEELMVCSHSSGQYTLPLLSWEVFCWEVEVLR